MKRMGFAGWSDVRRWMSRNLAVRASVPALVVLFVLYTATKAFFSAFWNDDFPESLAVKVELLPLIFPLHMIAGGLSLLLIPAVYALRHRSRWHRPFGWLTAGIVALAGATAFPVAWVAPVTLWSSAGFTMQALVWLGLLGTGIVHIRRKRRNAHRACMVLMAATTSGAVFFRIFLALWAIFGSTRQFEAFYACDAWLAWLLPLLVGSAWLWRNRRPARLAATMPAIATA